MPMQNVNQLKKHLSNIIKNSPKCDKWFYQEHILVVEELAMALCDKYPSANRDAVTLMVFLHDIGRADGHDENHDIYGAEYARQLLQANEFSPDFIELVADACKTHSCDDYGQPISLEGKILATADAMSHFQHGFYLRIFYAWSQQTGKMRFSELEGNQQFTHVKQKLFAKMDRDLNSKIFFPEAKQAVLPLYQAWRQAMGEIKL